MSVNPFTPKDLIGRQAELQLLSQIFSQDGDLLLAGVPGIGRRRLIQAAAQQMGARVVGIDCLRATNAQRCLELLAEAILHTFDDPSDLDLIQRWSEDQPVILERSLTRQAQLVWHLTPGDEWQQLRSLLTLPQWMAEWLNCRVVIVLQNFPHIRSWDRGKKWETYLRQEIQRQSHVSYVLIVTVPEDWANHNDLQVISLGPLHHDDLQPWLILAMAAEGLKFDPSTQALELFLNYVQGHVGAAIALARRIWLDYRISEKNTEGKPGERQKEDGNPAALIQPHHVHRSALALVQDLSFTFESLILLLPPSQVRVLESLALDPTHSPHSQDYIRKHQLSRGGGLQGALTSLEQKGLVYGAAFGYQMTSPLFAFWLKHRLS
jgi:hypothetical protein